jgi:hypothetical protein
VKRGKVPVFYVMQVNTNLQLHKRNAKIVHKVNLAAMLAVPQIALPVHRVSFSQQAGRHPVNRVVLGSTKIKVSKYLVKHVQKVSTTRTVPAQQHVQVVDLENIQINRAKHQQIHAKVALLVRMVMQMV